jgi:uncharacterized protein
MINKQTISILLLASIFLAACSGIGPPSPADSVNSPHTISVTGEGKAEAAPDIAIVNLGVETRDPSVAKAVADNNNKAGTIHQAVTGFGIDAKDIQTTGFNVYFQPVVDTQGQPTGQGTYIVSNTITITVRDLTKLGQILGGALDAGANSVSGINFSVANPAPLMSTARANAIADAQSRANEIAKGLKVEIVRVLAVVEGYAASPIIAPYSNSLTQFGKGGGPVPVESGTYTVTLQVSVVFEIK